MAKSNQDERPEQPHSDQNREQKEHNGQFEYLVERPMELTHRGWACHRRRAGTQIFPDHYMTATSGNGTMNFPPLSRYCWCWPIMDFENRHARVIT